MNDLVTTMTVWKETVIGALSFAPRDSRSSHGRPCTRAIPIQSAGRSAAGIQGRAARSKVQLHAQLPDLLATRSRVCGVGAPSRASILITTSRSIARSSSASAK